MPQPLSEAVVVITGASSGIGRATAITFARQGARVVVAARREEPLQEVVAECERAGGRALAVPTDVTDEPGVHALAEAALGAFGHLDVWVNNASVGLYARFEDAPADLFRQVIETNQFGYIHGARAALAAFRRQGDRGVLINVSSIAGTVAMPYASAYVMSKHAVRGLGATLREELSLEGASDIHVCTVLPATIDTPFFQHAANYTGKAVKAMPPVYSPESVARTIARLAERPEREVFVGNSARVFNMQQLVLPGPTEKMMAGMAHKMHLDQDQPVPPTDGNLLAPMLEGTSIHGGWGGGEPMPVPRGSSPLVVAGGLLLAIWLLNRSQQR